MRYKKLKDLADINFCTITPSRSKPSAEPIRWLACANFLADNEIDADAIINYVLPDKSWLLHENDIVIKRITPTFVNYIDHAPDDVYCANNLIIITPNESVDGKYLAMVLNEEIGNFSKESSVGAVMKSVSKSNLEAMNIPLPDLIRQQKIGLLWHNGIELKKKKMRLAELENIKMTYTLNKAIKSLGGKKNG